VKRCVLDASGSGQGSIYCEHDNGPSGSIKGKKFLDKLRYC
jgi:hypothetical protein